MKNRNATFNLACVPAECYFISIPYFELGWWAITLSGRDGSAFRRRILRWVRSAGGC